MYVLAKFNTFKVLKTKIEIQYFQRHVGTLVTLLRMQFWLLNDDVALLPC